jgi:hypothetical protein
MPPFADSTGFQHLPIELRKQIYIDTFATDGQRDATFTFQNDVLKGPPIMSLILADKQTHAEVFDMLFGEFRLCLIDTEKPHRFLLRSLLKSLKPVDRSRVKKIYLVNSTLQGLLYDPRFSALYDPSSFPSFQSRSQPIMRNIHSTFLLLSNALPALTQLDIEFDICECVPNGGRGVDSIEWLAQKKGLPQCYHYSGTDNPLATAALGLLGSGILKNLEVRLFWHSRIETLRREAGLYILSSDEIRNEVTHRYLELLRNALPAKSITAVDMDEH